MPGPHPAVAATRVAVRAHLADVADGDLVLVACSGGADSLALAAALAFEAPRAGVRAGAVVVDHGLQAGSDTVAARAADTCRGLGLDPVEVVAVQVAEAGAGGPEARARDARHAALEAAAARLGAARVLLGHTRDDQAEQVLLGLARGSGARSLAAMAPRRGVIARPFLGLGRDITTAACAAQGLTPWNDPHNEDRTYRRVRARALLAALEADLGPGIAAALARSAELLRVDADTLDALADDAAARLGAGPWPVDELIALPDGVRLRVWRRLAAAAGCPIADVSATHVGALDALLTRWHGQGPVALPGARRGQRRAGRIAIDPPGSWALPGQ